MKFNFDFKIYKFLLYIFLLMILVLWKHRKPRTVIRIRIRQAVIDVDVRRTSVTAVIRVTATHANTRASLYCMTV